MNICHTSREKCVLKSCPYIYSSMLVKLKAAVGNSRELLRHLKQTYTVNYTPVYSIL